MKDFSEAKHTVRILVRDKNPIGVLDFYLDKPMNQQPNYYALGDATLHSIIGLTS